MRFPEFEGGSHGQSVRNFGGSHGGPMGGSNGGSHVRIPKVGGGPMLQSQKLGGVLTPQPVRWLRLCLEYLSHSCLEPGTPTCFCLHFLPHITSITSFCLLTFTLLACLPSVYLLACLLNKS